MAESSGVSEAGKAWITISVNDEATAGLEQVSQSLETFSTNATSSMDAYDAVIEKTARSSAQHWQSIADSCTQAGELLTAAWGKLSVPAKEAVNVYSDFDDMIRAASAKMAGATAEELQGLYDQAKKLGAALSFTATDVAEGIPILQLVYLRLDETLLFSGGVVLGILTKIAFLSGGGDLITDFRHFLVFEETKFVFQALIPFQSHGERCGVIDHKVVKKNDVRKTRSRGVRNGVMNRTPHTVGKGLEQRYVCQCVHGKNPPLQRSFVTEDNTA